MTDHLALSRRHVLRFLGAGSAYGVLGFPGLALADVETERRLVVIMQRGAMDGLAAVPPYGDPRYHERRGVLALPMPGETDGIGRLDGIFGLHPVLAPLLPLWQARQLAVVPATFGGYRSRSHFEAQDMLETGLTVHQGTAHGWLNRALAVMPPAPSGRRLGLSMGGEVLLTLRGDVPVESWEPPNIRPASASLIAAVSHLYEPDALFGPALADGIKAKQMSDEVLGPDDSKMVGGKGGGPFRQMAEAAGGLLAAPDGPRIAALDIGGWDTHVGQGGVKGRLAQTLTQFAGGIDALRVALGPAWAKTVVVSVTEFGRTVAPNGTGGTDHGTASMTLVMGGAVKGGRIAGDWVGLDRLEENRDLRVATDIRSVLKSVLRDHLGVDQAKLDNAVFPGSGGVRPLAGLVQA
jgi:uncharacterized protein (DUF1501 family)